MSTAPRCFDCGNVGPTIEAWWRDLGQVRLSPELVDTIVGGVAAELAGTVLADRAARRDTGLRARLAVKAEGNLS